VCSGKHTNYVPSLGPPFVNDLRVTFLSNAISKFLLPSLAVLNIIKEG